MAEDEETATARYIASNVSTQLMLKTMFEIIATMANDPDGYRSDMRTKLLEIADTMPLAPMAAARELKVRAFVTETVGNLLINQRPNSSPTAQLRLCTGTPSASARACRAPRNTLAWTASDGCGSTGSRRGLSTAPRSSR